MAGKMKKSDSKPTSNSKEVYPYPSQFGSHQSMVDEEATAKLTDTSLVACRDEFGVYVTLRNRLDSGLADPCRYAEERLAKLLS